MKLRMSPSLRGSSCANAAREVAGLPDFRRPSLLKLLAISPAVKSIKSRCVAGKLRRGLEGGGAVGRAGSSVGPAGQQAQGAQSPAVEAPLEHAPSASPLPSPPSRSLKHAPLGSWDSTSIGSGPRKGALKSGRTSSPLSTFFFTKPAIAAAAWSSREGLPPSSVKVKLVAKSFEAASPLESATQNTTFTRPGFVSDATLYCTTTARPLQETLRSLRSCSCLLPTPIFVPSSPQPSGPGPSVGGAPPNHPPIRRVVMAVDTRIRNTT